MTLEGSEAFMRNTFLKWYPNAHLECCKASGHYPMIETPVALVTAIEKFLSIHSSAVSNEETSELDLSQKLLHENIYLSKGIKGKQR